MENQEATVYVEFRDGSHVISRGVADVLTERRRQVEVEGYTSEHDDEHNGAGGLVAAAYCYLFGAMLVRVRPELADPVSGCGHSGWWGYRILDSTWPWDRLCWKPGSVRHMLVKAGALIFAEIERLDRAEAKKAEDRS